MKLQEVASKTENIIKKLVSMIAAAILVVLSILNFFCTTYVEYSSSEVVSINTGFSLFCIPAVVLLFAICGLIFWGADHLPKEKVIWMFFCLVYLGIGLGLIFHVDSTLRGDAWSVHDAAKQFSQGDYSELLPGGYVFRKVHQLGLISFERIVGLISYSERLLFIINLILVNGINYITYKLCDLKFEHNKVVNVFAILLSYLILPQFFFILFAYGLIAGFFFFILAVYKMEQFFETRSKKSLIIMLIAITVSVLLKSNYLIGALTIMCCFMIQLLLKRKWIYAIIAMAAVTLPLVSVKAVNIYYEWESGIEIQSEEPKIMYVAMGINPMNIHQRGPGWYDASNWVWYEEAGFDAEIATQKAMECIRNSLLIYKEDPIGAVRFFVRKLASLWCEPMYQSVWSGPLADAGQQTNTAFLQELYNGGEPEKIICLLMKAYLIMIYLLVIVYFILPGKGTVRWECTLIYMIGGFFFHVFWEAKSQYVYTYTFALLPICAYSLYRIFQCMKNQWFANSK